MKAMILGAGKGTRVWPITKSIPKPMIPILGKPIMESIIEHFKQYGVDQIVVNTSYLAPVIENYFHTGRQFGVDISYSYEGNLNNGQFSSEPIGSAGGMKKIQDFSGFFDDTFIVVCGDALVDVDFAKVTEYHKQKKSIATIVMKEVALDCVESYGVVKTDSDGRIIQFQEKPKPEEAVSTSINTGIYIFEPEIFKYIPSKEIFDIGGDLFPLLVEKDLPFYGVSLDYNWLDVGSLKDIWHVTMLIMSGGLPSYKIPGRECKPGCRVGINTAIDLDKVDIQGNVCIGNGCRIEEGVKIIGPTVIGNNCVVKKGAVIESSIIDDYTWISSAAFIQEKVIFGGHCINKDGESVEVGELDLGWVISDARSSEDIAERHSELYDLATSL